jgi:hypothetical protein
MEEDEKAAAHKPNENLISQIDAPRSEPVDEVERDDDEVLQDPEAMACEEEEHALTEEAGEEEPAPTQVDADGGEFDATQLSLEETVSASQVSGEEVVAADAEGVAQGSVGNDPFMSSEAIPETTTKTAIPTDEKKNVSAKSLNDSEPTAADFADFESDAPSVAGAGEITSAKNFLQDAVKEVTARTESLGINVAKPAAEMNHAPSPHEIAGLLSKQLAAHDVSPPTGFEGHHPSTTPSTALSGVHQAVNAAMEAGERMKSGGQRAVDLQFSFGSDDLSVRVELHEGRVRATFRTDSAELRGALAQEWQVLNAAGADRARRFADPVFAANSSTSSAGDHHEKRGGRDQDMRAPAEGIALSNSRSVSAPATARSIAPTMSPQTAVPITALRLHTFA